MISTSSSFRGLQGRYKLHNSATIKLDRTGSIQECVERTTNRWWLKTVRANTILLRSEAYCFSLYPSLCISDGRLCACSAHPLHNTPYRERAASLFAVIYVISDSACPCMRTLCPKCFYERKNDSLNVRRRTQAFES